MATHEQKEALILLSREIAQASTGMTPGFTNMLGGRPSVSPSIRLFSFLISKEDVKATIDINGKQLLLDLPNEGGFEVDEISTEPVVFDKLEATDAEVPLVKLAYARSGDKGDHANIGVIARKSEFLPYIRAYLTPERVAAYFAHVVKGKVDRWDLPGIGGFNFLLRNSLGGGGMASLNVDPQGKAYAQQLLDIIIPVPRKITEEVNK
jgi:hypothetical protein